MNNKVLNQGCSQTLQNDIHKVGSNHGSWPSLYTCQRTLCRGRSWRPWKWLHLYTNNGVHGYGGNLGLFLFFFQFINMSIFIFFLRESIEFNLFFFFKIKEYIEVSNIKVMCMCNPNMTFHKGCLESAFLYLCAFASQM